EGDVFSWGRGFNGETGLFEQVESVPRFAPLVTKFRVVKVARHETSTVSCGDAHVLAVTDRQGAGQENQQCISWGSNTCGQLGIGCKSKPTYKPQLLDSIPSLIKEASAGWAHSVAVGTDGRVYSWGLNSHGQLGLGDVAPRLAPHLLHDLVGVHQVESAHAARTLTAFLTAEKRPLLCGQIPFGPSAKHNVEFHPRRPASRDPAGCVLAPVPLTIAAPDPSGVKSQLTQVMAYDRGVVAFARSAVHKAATGARSHNPTGGVRVHVNGLPYSPPGRTQSVDSMTTSVMLADYIPVKVRLKSSSPLCDFIVPGRIVDVDTLEFTTPPVVHSPLGSVVSQGITSAVEVRVSVDNGLTWSRAPERAAPQKSLQGKTKPIDHALQQGLQGLLGQSAAARQARDVHKAESALLWYSRWPEDGPTHAEPRCVPVAGGAELLLHVALPPQMPAEHLLARFVCTPLQSIGDPALEGGAPTRRAAAEMVNPDQDAVAKLPLAMPLKVPVVAWLDAGGQGVRVVSPPLDAENIRFYDYSVELSLDGRTFLPHALPLSVYDLSVTALEPSTGSLLEQTEVKVRCTGLVQSDIHWVQLDFPPELGWKRRQLPASLDLTTGEVSFTMPDLAAEARELADAAIKASRAEEEEEEAARRASGASGAEDAAAPAPAAADPYGGLVGVEVSVELSLNGQNFTHDGVTFTFHGPPEPVAEEEPPAEEVPAEPKAKGSKKKATQEEPKPATPVEPKPVPPPELKPSVSAAAVRADLTVKAVRSELDREKLREVPPFPFFGKPMCFQDEFAALQVTQDGRFCFSALTFDHNAPAPDKRQREGARSKEPARGSTSGGQQGAADLQQSPPPAPAKEQRVVTYEGVFQAAPDPEAWQAQLAAADPDKGKDRNKDTTMAGQRNSKESVSQKELRSSPQEHQVASVIGFATVRYEMEALTGTSRPISVERGEWRFAITVYPDFEPTGVTVLPIGSTGKPSAPGKMAPRKRQLPYVGPYGCRWEQHWGWDAAKAERARPRSVVLGPLARTPKKPPERPPPRRTVFGDPGGAQPDDGVSAALRRLELSASASAPQLRKPADAAQEDRWLSNGSLLDGPPRRTEAKKTQEEKEFYRQRERDLLWSGDVR
ncbi:unnamed protein product, partial [Prorocentrum cordatum]